MGFNFFALPVLGSYALATFAGILFLNCTLAA